MEKVNTKLRADRTLFGACSNEKRTRRKYSDEYKSEAVKRVTDQGYKAAEAARNFGIHVGILRRWISTETTRGFSYFSRHREITSRTQTAEA